MLGSLNTATDLVHLLRARTVYPRPNAVPAGNHCLCRQWHTLWTVHLYRLGQADL